MTHSSRHVASLTHGQVVHDSALGSVRTLSSDTLPALKGMSMRSLILEPGAVREPHWHANADELGCCLTGRALVSILDNADVFASFTVTAGQMFHIDSGSLHAIENIGDERAEFVIVFSHERVEDFSLHGAFGAMSDAVLGNTYGLPSADLAGLTRDVSSPILVKRSGGATIPDGAGFLDPHKFDVEGQNAPLDYEFGSAKLARAQFWPALKNLSMYSLRIGADGMREPHWHPMTSELGYVHQGQARMTILDPDGTMDTYTLAPGDAYFVPPAYPHHIEVLGTDEIHFLVFFDQPTPGDIGYRASASAFRPDILAATFGISEAVLPPFPFTPIDPLMVRKVNPTDPIE